MQLTTLQQHTVDQILDLYNPRQKTVCEFKSPTGSGKTLMASAFISNLIERYNEQERFIFVIATPSSSSLPYFFEQKINKYKKDLPFSKFEVEYIQSPSATKGDKSEAIQKIVPQQNKVYIFGKASFGKNRILSEYGIIADFVKYAVEQGYKLIYIRDEAHIGGEKVENGEQAQNFETLMNSNAHFVLKMTATPDYKNAFTQKVVLREKDLNNELLNEGRYLLKTTAEPILDKSLNDTEVLGEAIKKFKTIKDDYAKLNIGINPAMLIQVDNSSTTDKEKKAKFEAALAEIKSTLNQANLAWVQYFGDGDKDSNRVYKKDFSLDDITDNRNDIDVVIFKIGPATGWDIPRACMLVQLRNVSSQSLNTQTLGRIKRNPYPNLEKNAVTDKYYVLSNIKDNDDEVKTYNYKVREKFAGETFLKIEITNAKELKKSQQSNPRFKEAFAAYLEENKTSLKQEVNSAFAAGGTKYEKVVMLTSNGNQIKSAVSNPFIFLRDYKRLLIANKYYYENIKDAAAKFAKTEKLQESFLITILLEKHKKDIQHILQQTRDFNPKYEIKESIYDPKDYQELYSGSSNEKNINREYLFDITSNSNAKNQQPLDSKPEEIVFQKIYSLAEEEKIRIWAKNQTTSNIYGDYLDHHNNLRKSYFDFIIKFKNDFYLYLEVKGKHDIDAEKTALLEQAYDDYFTSGEKNLFSPKLAIAVCRVDTENGSIATKLFYDKNEIKERLNEKSFDENMKVFSEKDCYFEQRHISLVADVKN